MTLLLTIKNKLVTLTLLKGSDVIGSDEWEDKRNLMEQLLPHIDQLLQDNATDITQIKHFRSDIDVPESYSTYRIAKATMETFQMCRG